MRYRTVLTLVGLTACTGTIVDHGAGAGGDDDDDDDAISTVDAAPPPPDALPPELPLAAGLRIRQIAVYQGVKVPIVDDGAPIPDADRVAPIIEGGDAMIGVLLDLDPSWQPREIVGVLEIAVSAEDVRTYTLRQTITAASGDDPFTTGFAFVVDGADVVLDARYAVALYETNLDVDHGGATDGARFPAADERAALEVHSIHGPLHLVLVPFVYDGDGSGRMPPVDEASLQEYRALFESMYPIGEVELSVREPVSYNGSISSGGGWSQWLDTLTAIRDDDNPPPNTYYYGIASPRASFSAFCNGGCIIGLGWVPGRDDGYGRAAVGVSFPERLGLYTCAHEVGHTMGRSHAPCGGPSGVDWSYPYSGAAIGVWGYDASAQTLKAPDEFTDVMGYCSDQWISDYTYRGIFERLAYVNQLTAAANAPRRYRVGLVDGDGNVTWRRYDDIQSRVGGEQRAIAWLDDAGVEVASGSGRFYPYDHLPGGMLLVPVDDARSAQALRIDGLGTVKW